jgi:hypothetical protein
MQLQEQRHVTLVVELEDFIIQTLDLLQVVELVVEVLRGQIVEMQLLTLAVEEVHLMPTPPLLVALEVVVQVSLSQEQVQLRELLSQLVLDVQEVYLT